MYKYLKYFSMSIHNTGFSDGRSLFFDGNPFFETDLRNCDSCLIYVVGATEESTFSPVTVTLGFPLLHNTPCGKI